jgi:hypothetical protein
VENHNDQEEFPHCYDVLLNDMGKGGGGREIISPVSQESW